MDYKTRQDFQFRATKQHVRRQMHDEIRSNLANMQQERGTNLADFLSPAIRNLGLVGTGLGAAKGALEPGTDELGRPMNMSGRLGNILTNSVVGGVAGAGAGVGYKALNPGNRSLANQVGSAIQDIPDAIAGKQGVLDKITDTANADVLNTAKPSKLGQTTTAVKSRIRRDKGRVKQFFTGRGEGITTEARPVGKTATIVDPTTKEVTREFIPTVDKFGDNVTETITRADPNAKLDQTPAVKRVLQSVGGAVGGTTGAVAGSVAGPIGTVAGGAGGVGAGVALGGAIGDNLVEVADGINSNGFVKGVWNKTKQDVERVRQGLDFIGDAPKQTVGNALSGIGNGYSNITNSPGVQRVGNTIKTQLSDIRQNLGFEQSSKQIVHFGSPSMNGYTLGAGTGLALGTTAGTITNIADTMSRQRQQEQQELQDINAIDNPYMRVGAYQDYTNEDNTNMRALRDSGDVLARGALGAGVGAGVGLGVGGLAGSLIDNAQKKRGLLAKLRG
jgi:hypothetical protein